MRAYTLIVLIVVGLWFGLIGPLQAASIRIGKPQPFALDHVPLTHVAVSNHPSQPNTLVVWIRAAEPGQAPRLMGSLVGFSRRDGSIVEIARLDLDDAGLDAAAPTVSFNPTRRDYLVVYRRTGSRLVATRLDSNGRRLDSEIVVSADPAARQPRVSSFGARSLIVWTDAEGIRGGSFDPAVSSTSLSDIQTYAIGQASSPVLPGDAAKFLVYQVPDASTSAGSSVFVLSLDTEGSPTGPASLLVKNALEPEVPFYASPSRRAVAWVGTNRARSPAVYALLGKRRAQVARGAVHPRWLETARKGQSLIAWKQAKSGRLMARFISSGFGSLTNTLAISRGAILGEPGIVANQDGEDIGLVWSERGKRRNRYRMMWQSLDTSGTVQRLAMSASTPDGWISISSSSSSTTGGQTSGSTESRSVRYTIWIHNPSPLTATGVRLDFTNTRLDLEKVKSRSGGGCRRGFRRGYCDLPDLESGGLYTVTIRGSLSCSGTRGYQYEDLLDARVSWGNSPSPRTEIHRSQSIRVGC